MRLAVADHGRPAEVIRMPKRTVPSSRAVGPTERGQRSRHAATSEAFSAAVLP